MSRVTITALLVFLALTACAGAAPKAPNVIVIFSDDHGWADLGANGSQTDVKTPQLNALAREGVRFARGYVTAPQCVPSRAGLLTGRHQQRFGVEDNLQGPLPLSEKTMAHYMSDAGYTCGMVGKWHLDVKTEQPKGAARQSKQLPEHLPHKFGFPEMFCGTMNNYNATHDLEGKPVEGGVKLLQNRDYRVDVQTRAALSFLDRHANQPFFLYLAYFAPHVPSEAPPQYMDRFKGVSDEKRRVALAMISAIDDGVGAIRERLKKHGVADDTLIIFIGDNGAPLRPNAWNGSLNNPLVGEKGMVTDGGIRVPFLAWWPNGLPKGKVFEEAVSSLDVIPTVLAAAGRDTKAEWKLDGVNLLPFVRGEQKGAPHPQLFWRWRSQAAVLEGRMKLVYLAPNTWYLFDTTKPEGEKGENDLSAKHPDKVADLKKKLVAWAETLQPSGLPKNLTPEDARFFADHVDKSPAVPMGKDGRISDTPTPAESAAALKAHDRAIFIKPGWIRDPYIVLASDGSYYLTGTTPLPGEPREKTDPYNTGLGNESIVGWKMQARRSRDLIQWESLDAPYSLKDGIWFSAQPEDFKKANEKDWRLWAPELHEIDGKWAIVHTSPGPVKAANLSFTKDLKLQGPFANPMGTNIGRRHDPSLFKDDDGTWWLIWGATEIARLKKDFSDLDGAPITIGPSGETAKMGHEGCLLRKIGTKYVLFGTGWSTGEGRKGSYNLYYATADRITGPYSERKFAGRFLGHGTPFQDRDGRWWCTAFYNGNVPPLSTDGIVTKDLSATAQTINPQGVTLVPLDVTVDKAGDVFIRARDPNYATPGPDEKQKFK